MGKRSASFPCTLVTSHYVQGRGSACCAPAPPPPLSFTVQSTSCTVRLIRFTTPAFLGDGNPFSSSPFSPLRALPASVDSFPCPNKGLIIITLLKRSFHLPTSCHKRRVEKKFIHFFYNN